MTYKIRILENAQEDLEWFRRNDKTSSIKCFDRVREIVKDPRTGTGKPERLRYFEKEVYSRRINHKDRLIYTIYGSCTKVTVHSPLPLAGEGLGERVVESTPDPLSLALSPHEWGRGD